MGGALVRTAGLAKGRAKGALVDVHSRGTDSGPPPSGAWQPVSNISETQKTIPRNLNTRQFRETQKRTQVVLQKLVCIAALRHD
jgi:hypothetical protein